MPIVAIYQVFQMVIYYKPMKRRRILALFYSKASHWCTMLIFTCNPLTKALKPVVMAEWPNHLFTRGAEMKYLRVVVPRSLTGMCTVHACVAKEKQVVEARKCGIG